MEDKGFKWKLILKKSLIKKRTSFQLQIKNDGLKAKNGEITGFVFKPLDQLASSESDEDESECNTSNINGVDKQTNIQNADGQIGNGQKDAKNEQELQSLALMNVQ